MIANQETIVTGTAGHIVDLKDAKIGGRSTSLYRGTEQKRSVELFDGLKSLTSPTVESCLNVAESLGFDTKSQFNDGEKIDFRDSSTYFPGNADPRTLVYWMFANPIDYKRQQNDWDKLPGEVMSAQMWLADRVGLAYSDWQATASSVYQPDEYKSGIANQSLKYVYYPTLRGSIHMTAEHGPEMLRDTGGGQYKIGFQMFNDQMIMRKFEDEVDQYRKWGFITGGQQHGISDPQIYGYFNNPSLPATQQLYPNPDLETGITAKEIIDLFSDMIIDLNEQAFNSKSGGAGKTVPATLMLPDGVYETFNRIRYPDVGIVGPEYTLESKLKSLYPNLTIQYWKELNTLGAFGSASYRLMLNRSVNVQASPIWWFDTAPVQNSYNKLVNGSIRRKKIWATAGTFVDPMSILIRHGSI